ncbi:MAG: hypothetical protein J6Q29_02530 [Alistipes sp.]|nr:hypothetical protein [Alistipes sp.]
MKKNYFLLLCSMLLSISLLGTACSDDAGTPPPTPEEPSFPAAVVKTATAGEIIELTFDANYNWIASISDEAYTYFQLLNGENTAKTIAGAKGEDITIKVKVADVTIYDNAPSTEVTLTMNNQSKVIATITYPVTDRTFDVYAPVYNEYGVFQGTYEDEAIAEDDVLEMVYGAPVNGEDSTFFVPVKLASNFPFIIAGPEWMVAMDAGVAGDNEVIIKADPTKIPADATEATIDILVDSDSEEPVASFKVSLAGADNFFAIENLDEEGNVSELLVEYTYDGTLTANSAKLSSRPLTSSKNVVIKAIDANGDAIEWFTVAAQQWDDAGAAIQTRILTISDVEENDGAVSREAYIYAVPQSKADSFDIDSADADTYYVATVMQHTAPATISIDEDVFDTTTTKFATAGSDVNFWFTEGNLSNLYIGNRYDISYYGADAEWGSDNDFIASRAIESFEYYAYNAEGAFAQLTDDTSWVAASTFGAEKVKFNIFVDPSVPSFNDSVFALTGEAEAVILVKYTDGTYSGIYFHYKEDTESASTASITCENFAEEIAFESVEGNGWPFSQFSDAEEFYTLNFGGWQYEDTAFIANDKTINAIKTYAYQPNGDLVEDDDTWYGVWLNGIGNRFKIQDFDTNHADAEYAFNLMSNVYEAVVVVEFTDGTSAVISVAYSKDAVVGGGSLLSFANPMYAPMEGSTLTELTSGDFYDFAKGEFGAAAVWELTYSTTSPTLSAVTGFDESWTIFQKSDWINFEYSEGGSTIKMNSTVTDTGYIVFSDGSGCPLVLICSIVLE